MKIVPFVNVNFSHAVMAGLDEIFYEASATKSFASADARAAFRERWLGSYLTLDASEAFLALDDRGNVAGYVIGSLLDPASDPRHEALGYFRDFAPWTQNYPAHLHINVASQYRSLGLGARLVDAFAEHAAARGAPGLHVVTGKGMRNVGFYVRNGFALLAESNWNDRTVVMLGRPLRPAIPG